MKITQKKRGDLWSASITQPHKDFIDKKRVEILEELKEYLREVEHKMTAEDVLAEV